MPRSGSENAKQITRMEHAAASTRIRDNQRRSRARRKEYVQDLEQRLQRFEELGVRATHEVQAAGRKVAEENTLLRSLLRLHGIGEAEIEAYLNSHRGSVSPTLSGALSMSAPASAQAALPIAQLLRTSHHLSAGPNHYPREPQGTRSAIYHTEESSHHVKGIDDGLQEQNVAVDGSHRPDLVSLGHANLSRSQDVYGKCPDAGEQNSRGCAVNEEKSCDQLDPDRGQVTSCETAARIITSMRGSQDVQEAQAQLGCAPSEPNCTVKNMVIFDILDL